MRYVYIVNTLPNFQEDRKTSRTRRNKPLEKLVSNIEKEVRKYGNSYCFSRRIERELVSKGYTVTQEGLVEKGDNSE